MFYSETKKNNCDCHMSQLSSFLECLLYAYDIRLPSPSVGFFQTMRNEFYEITYMYSALLLFNVSKCYW